MSYGIILVGRFVSDEYDYVTVVVTALFCVGFFTIIGAIFLLIWILKITHKEATQEEIARYYSQWNPSTEDYSDWLRGKESWELAVAVKEAEEKRIYDENYVHPDDYGLHKFEW